MIGGVTRVLFLSTRNAGRSILAEALLNRLGAGRFEAYSAGFAPATAISAFAVAQLEKIKYRTSQLTPKSVELFQGPAAPAFDLIVRLSDDFPAGGWVNFPGAPQVVDWRLEDPELKVAPKAEIANDYARLFDGMVEWLDAFSLIPVAELDAATINKRIDRLHAWADRFAA